VGLVTAHYIREAYKNYECRDFIVYGPRGYGKTSYALQVLMELYKTDEPDVLSKYFAFTPTEFMDKMDKFNERVPGICFDDAGVWLFSLDYGRTEVKNLVKVMSIIRTMTASTIFTSLLPTLIVNKLRTFPQTQCIKISKTTGNPYKKNVRQALGYRSWLLPDMHKWRIKKDFIDTFSIMLPDPLFEWYEKERMFHVKQLQDEIRKSLKSTKTKDEPPKDNANAEATIKNAKMF
jgi:hypothetical protein